MAGGFIIKEIPLCSLHSIYWGKEEDCVVSENKINPSRKNKEAKKCFRVTLHLKVKFVSIAPWKTLQANPLTPSLWQV